MRRALLLILGISLVTWLEFRFYPGHSYLRGDTQLYVPVLERLDAPGFLSRDLIASNPHVAYTIYDEVTLFLHEVMQIDLQRALQGQQIVSRAAAILGILLFGFTVGLGDLPAFTLAAFVNLGITLSAPAISLVEQEPIPRALALGLLLLAFGLFAREKPLLGGLAAGVALLYDVMMAAPLWIIIIAGFLFNRRLRHLFRPAFTILLVFLLLLANLAQLQPGELALGKWTSRISPAFATLQQFRTPFAWVSHWDRADLWGYLFVYVCGICAVLRIWPALNPQTRWFFTWLPLYGILNIPLSYLLLERFGWSMISQLQPARAVLFTVVLSSIACGLSAMRAAIAGFLWESAVWFLVFFSIAIDARVLNLLSWRHLTQAGVCLGLAATSALLIQRLLSTNWRPVVLLAPVAAIIVLWRVNAVQSRTVSNDSALDEVAQWARQNTWGSSMFIFPDAGRTLYPGIFRARSKRAVWVDWMSGEGMTYSEAVGAEWWSRWQQTMQGGFSPSQLQSESALPIDYYVLERMHGLAGVRPAFFNSEYFVYDAQDLRNFAKGRP